jgi:CrcB protein
MMAAVPPVLLVALGGGAGAALRWMVGGWAATVFGPGFAWGTWIINLSGSFLLGWLLARLGTVPGGEHEPLRLLLGVGLLGGFTTFSAFSVELVGLVNRADIGMAAAYAISSVAGGVVAAFLGIALGRL